MSGLVFYIPEKLAATPVDGECIVNAYWTVHPTNGVAFYMSRKRPWGLEPGEADEPSPQCNRDRYTAEALQKKIYPEHEVKQIPVVFLRHAAREMHQIRKAATAAHKPGSATGRE